MKQHIRLVSNNLDLYSIIQFHIRLQQSRLVSIGIFHARLKIISVYLRFTRPTDLKIKNSFTNNTIQHRTGGL